MSRHRTMSPERRDLYRGQRGPKGRALCSWCGTETAPPRRSFCSAGCVHEWLLRTRTSYLRRHVKLRDKGICVGCSVDCYKLRRVIRAYAKLTSRNEARDLLKELGFGNVNDLERSFWEADHIESVIEGGGECGLENIQTVCLACHKAKTKELARRRAAARKQKDPDAQEPQDPV